MSESKETKKQQVNPKLLIICGLLLLGVGGIYAYDALNNPIKKAETQINGSNTSKPNNTNNKPTNKPGTTPNKDNNSNNNTTTNNNVTAMDIPEVNLDGIDKLQGSDYKKSDDFIAKAKEYGYYKSTTRLNPFVDKYYREGKAEESNSNQSLKESNLPKGQIFNSAEYGQPLEDIK